MNDQRARIPTKIFNAAICASLLICAMASVHAGGSGKAAIAAGTAIEDSDADWTWVGMQSITGDAYHKGSVRAGGPASSGVYVFTGAGVRLFGIHAATITVEGKPHALGKMNITIDGKQKAAIDLSTPPADPDARIFEVKGLTDGNHVLQAKVTEGWGAIDYITVQAPEDDGGKNYRIGPKNSSNSWLDSETETMADDSGLNIYWGPRLNHSQVWHVVPTGDNKFRISPKEKPDEAISVLTRQYQGVNRSGLMAYTGATAQQWEIIASSDGYYKIANAVDHKCLNVFDGLKADGTLVNAYQWQDNNQDNDQWRFVPVP